MFLLRLVCAANGLMMFSLGIYGLVLPFGAMELMAGMTPPDHPSLYPLMRMHTAADLGLGLGFFLVAWRPLPSFPAMVLCLGANFAHGLVHVLELAQGGPGMHHVVPIFGLVIMSIVLAVLYPWKAALQRYLTGPAV